MNTLDIHHLIELSENNQEDEARKIITEYFDNLSPADKGQAYVALGSVYLDLVSENHAQLAAVLDFQLERLKELDKVEKEVVEEMEVEQLRAQLS